MTNIYKLFKEETWKPDDLTSVIWFSGNDELTYNQHSNLHEMMNGDGMTYSYQVRGEIEKGGFVIFTLQDDCGGDSFQAIFDLSKKVDEDNYWEEFEEGEEE